MSRYVASPEYEREFYRVLDRQSGRTARYIGHSFAQAFIGALMLMALTTAADIATAKIYNRKT